MKITRIDAIFKDDRGDIADIFYKHPIDHVAIINSKKGAIRGNHFHKKSIQHMYITKGSLRYYYLNVGDDYNNVKSVVVKEGEMVTTPPYEMHALETLEDNQYIVFSEGLRGGRDYESDTFRVEKTIIRKRARIRNIAR